MFQNPRIKNRGIGGDTSVGVLKRLDQIISDQPLQIFLMMGINDLWNGVPVERVADNYRQVLAQVKSKAPATNVLIQSVLPMNGAWSSTPERIPIVNRQVFDLNKKLRELGTEFFFSYVDLFSLFVKDDQLDPQYTTDGLHINGKGYIVWKAAIERFVAKNPFGDFKP